MVMQLHRRLNITGLWSRDEHLIGLSLTYKSYRSFHVKCDKQFSSQHSSCGYLEITLVSSNA